MASEEIQRKLRSAPRHQLDRVAIAAHDMVQAQANLNAWWDTDEPDFDLEGFEELNNAALRAEQELAIQVAKSL